MSLYIINTYRSPSRLFICGGGEILSQEGTTQEDLLATLWYSVNTSIMIQSLRISTPGVRQVWLADDSAGGGQIVPLHNWYNYLSQEGKKYGYLVNGPKSWLKSNNSKSNVNLSPSSIKNIDIDIDINIVKSDALSAEAKKVFGDEVNITTGGQRHLGAVIGSRQFKDQYCREKVLGWKGELEALSEIGVYLFVEGRGSRVPCRGPRVIFITKRRFLFCRCIFFCWSVQFGLHVPPRFDLMSLNMIALHIINVFATAEYSYSQPTTRQMTDVVCSIQDQRFNFEDRGSGISHLPNS